MQSNLFDFCSSKYILKKCKVNNNIVDKQTLYKMKKKTV